MDLKRYVPNAFTSMNLACGTGALLCAVDGRPSLIPVALALVTLAILFDMADGRVARSLNITSPLGLELDSLADLVSFGVAPALLLWKFRLADMGPAAVVATVAFVLAGAFRLARFNVLSQTGQSSCKSFVGLPIPGAAAFVLVVGLGQVVPGFWLASPAGVVLATVVVTAFLMVCTIPFPSPKALPLGNRRFALGLVAALVGATATIGGNVLLVAPLYVLSTLALRAAQPVARLSRRLLPRRARA